MSAQKIKNIGTSAVPLNWIVMWLKYLFAKPFSLRALICRAKGHKCGVIWYNPGGYEPDMHCKNCGDCLD